MKYSSALTALSMAIALTVAAGTVAAAEKHHYRHHRHHAGARYSRYFIASTQPLAQTYNELSPGNRSSFQSYRFRTGIEFRVARVPLVAMAGVEQVAAPHRQNSGTPVDCATHPSEQGCVRVIGGGGRVFIPAFNAREYSLDFRLGVKVARPKIYLTGNYLYRSTNFGTPELLGYGVGVAALPAPSRSHSLYGDLSYYPNIANEEPFIDPSTHAVLPLSYHVIRYQLGQTHRLGEHVFLDYGIVGDYLNNRRNAPADALHRGVYVGVGVNH